MAAKEEEKRDEAELETRFLEETRKTRRGRRKDKEKRRKR